MKTWLFLMVGLLCVTACTPVQASIPNPNDIGSQPRAILYSIVPTSTAEIMEPAEGSSAALLQEVSDLSEQRKADLTAAPGWLHLLIRTTRTADNSLSNWWLPPGESEQENWLELDGSGKIITAVNRITKIAGQPDQVILLVDGTWRNLTLGAESPAQEKGPFDPNYGFYELAAQMVQQGHTLNKGILYQECWYVGEKYTIADGRTMQEAVFNPDKRSLRWVKTWHITAGVVKLVESTEIAIEERVAQPPADVLALLEKTGIH